MSAKVERLQALFAPLNEDGAFMIMAQDGCETVNLGLIDSWLVTRVERDAFWLFLKAVDYYQGFLQAQTIKVVSWNRTGSYCLDMMDDRGRRFHVEMILDVNEHVRPGLIDTWGRWQAWQGYRRHNRELLAKVDAQLLAEHVNIALNWGLPSEAETPGDSAASDAPASDSPSGNMTVRYMAELKRRQIEDFLVYDPVGVWVIGSGGDLDLVVRYRPGYDDEEASVEVSSARMKQAGVRVLPIDFLEFHTQFHEEQFPYAGTRGPIITTDAYASTEECAQAVLEMIEEERARRVRVRYMVEWKRRDDEFKYDPIGVWVVGPGSGPDLVIRFLPGYEEEKANADALFERRRTSGMQDLPSGFLDFHSDQYSAYSGDRGPIVTTDEFSSTEECAEAVLKMIEVQYVNIALNRGIPLADEEEPEEPAPSGSVTIRYMVESKRRGDGEKPFFLGESPLYDPIGVWVLGPGPGLDLIIRLLPGYEEEQAEHDTLLERMRVADVRAIPSGFLLEFYEQHFSWIKGTRGPIITTDEYASTEECAQAVLKMIEEERAGLELSGGP